MPANHFRWPPCVGDFPWSSDRQSRRGDSDANIFFDMKDGVPLRDRIGVEFDTNVEAIEHSRVFAPHFRDERLRDDEDLEISVSTRRDRKFIASSSTGSRRPISLPAPAASNGCAVRAGVGPDRRHPMPPLSANHGRRLRPARKCCETPPRPSILRCKLKSQPMAASTWRRTRYPVEWAISIVFAGFASTAREG